MCCTGAPGSPISYVGLELTARGSIRHSSSLEQHSLAAWQGCHLKLTLLGKLSLALPLPGSIFMIPPGSLRGPSRSVNTTRHAVHW